MNSEPLLARVEDLETMTQEVETTAAERLLAIRRASGRFRGETENHVTLVEADVVLLDGNGTNKLLLPAAPVVGDVVVKVDGVDVSAEVRVSRKNGILRRIGDYWPCDYENVEVTYSHGYPEADIPADIQDAVLEHAATMLLTHAHLAQEGAGGVQATYGPSAMVGRTQKWSDAVARYTLKDRI